MTRLSPGAYLSEDAVVRDALEQLRSHTPLPEPGQGLIGAVRGRRGARPGRRTCHEGPRGAAVAARAG